MEKRKLGRTNLEVGVIGFGGIPIQRLKEEEAIDLIKKAADEGINFIDSARAYGESEKLIGKGIAGNRDHWYIATKTMARDYESMKKEVETSLADFNIDTIDLYQFHLVKTEAQLEQILAPDGAFRALKEAQEAGKIKEIGITSHSAELLEMAIETDYFSTIQFPYNIVERQGEALFKRAAEKNIGVIIMKPLAGGALEDGDLALRFILQNPNVTVVIPGVDKEEQVYENANVGKNFVPLSEVDQKRIEEIKQSLGTTFCRRCGYCLPCPQKIDIPTQFLMEGYYSRYELQNWAVERYGVLPKKASECVECGVCESKCPYDLPIRSMLKNVVAKLEPNNK
ncbi:aldo/keto reductase [Alkaliphilus hydrothermalis]|uniref:Aldo/keto reductase-like oxidoreductase n=1 Tax=Alkaliphilus hydrothermalis TaxID=1482730 RepID=A0ABS2NMN1_9FIRM|nr:aldo/keto reductase [Alkaliphilus hydrothermalis]MBM7614188.1 putative aldo/keto reductase-like oxidoreductase [Alkaliphilus hydrothermalis]